MPDKWLTDVSSSEFLLTLQRKLFEQVFIKERSNMDFQPSEITQHAAQTARDFANQYIRPHVMEWDETQEFPVQCFKEMGKLGMMGVLLLSFIKTCSNNLRCKVIRNSEELTSVSFNLRVPFTHENSNTSPS